MNLLEWKQKSGWRWTEMGARLCVSGGYLSQIANRQAIPSEQVALAIVAFTRGDVTYEDLCPGGRLVCKKKRTRGPSFNRYSNFLISHKVEKCRDENDMHML